jgi:site-specific recombinase XerD
MDRFYRWVWDRENGYTTQVSHWHADQYLDELAYEDYSNAHKNNCLKALKMLFKWRHHQLHEEPWEPSRRFKQENRRPRYFFRREERRKIKQAALEYGSVPHYNSVSPAERDRWKAYLAQRFGMSMSEVKQGWDA